MAAGDFNGDGTPDLAIAGDGVSVFLNACTTAGIKLAPARTGNTITFSWPLPYTNFVLESTTTLGSTNWQGVSGVTTTNNGRCEATVSLDPGQRHFRLRKP